MQKSRNDLQKTGLFNPKNLQKINRQSKPCIFSSRLKKNLTSYLFDFFPYRELSEICSTNIFLHNCFVEYELPSWKIEMLNIIDIFNLDIKDPNKEIDDSLSSCIKNKRIYKIKNTEGNYVKFDNEGINLISLAYFDPEMKLLIENKKNKDINFDFHEIDFIYSDNDNDLDLDDDTHHHGSNYNSKFESIYSEMSYVPGNILFLDETCPLDFSFSFHHVIRDNYKFYLHQSMTNMRNAKLVMQIIINDEIVFEREDFPSQRILNESTIKQFNKLNEVYICDIKKNMFDKVKNSLKYSLSKDFTNIDLKNSIKSDISTECDSLKNSIKSQSSLKTQNSIKSQNNINNKDFTIKIRFRNTHLFWKAGWYLDGGKLVRSII